MRYIACLGRQKEFGAAELESFGLELEQISTIALFESAELEPVSFLDRLGGTVKLGEALEVVKELTPDTLIPLLGSLDKEKKVVFGISLYGLPRTLRFDLGMQLKRALKKEGYKVRYLDTKGDELSSVVVHEEKAIDLLLVRHGKQFLVGRTLAVQNYKRYMQLDYDRPKRDMRVGMLPPKLAQILINLGLAGEDGEIFDPFVGLGTVPMMASLIDMTCHGSDIEQRMISCTEENMRFMKETFHVSFEGTYWCQDASKPFDALVDRQVSAIVTEGYLGPPMRKQIGPKDAFSVLEQLSVLWGKVLKNAISVLEPGGRVVFCLPIYKHDKGWIRMDDGRFLRIVPKTLSLVRRDLVYFREDQFVGREVIVLELTG